MLVFRDTNEALTSANIIHIAIYDHYAATVFFNKIYNCGEFTHPYDTANNALKVEVYNYSVEDCHSLLQEWYQKLVTVL